MHSLATAAVRRDWGRERTPSRGSLVAARGRFPRLGPGSGGGLGPRGAGGLPPLSAPVAGWDGGGAPSVAGALGERSVAPAAPLGSSLCPLGAALCSAVPGDGLARPGGFPCRLPRLWALRPLRVTEGFPSFPSRARRAPSLLLDLPCAPSHLLCALGSSSGLDCGGKEERAKTSSGWWASMEEGQRLPVPASLLPQYLAVLSVVGACPAAPQEAAAVGWGAWCSDWWEWNSTLAWLGSKTEAEFEQRGYCFLSPI